MKNFRSLLRFLGPYWIFTLAAPLFMLLEVGMDLSLPRLMQNIIDNAIPSGEMSIVIRQGVIMLIMALAGMVGGVGCSLASVRAAVFGAADLRQRVFDKVQNLSFSSLDTLERGSLVTRLTSDVMQIQTVFMMMLRMMVRAPLLVLGSLAMAIVTSPRLSLVFTVMIPLLILVTVLVMRKALPIFRGVQKKIDKVNQVMEENLYGVRLVRVFNRSRFEEQRFGDVNDSLMELMLKASRIVAVVMPLMFLFINLGIGVSLLTGGLNVMVGSLKIGQLIAFINYLTQLLFSLMMLSMFLVMFSRAEASAERIREVLDQEDENASDSGTEPFIFNAPTVEFRNVSFSYDDADTLSELSFSLPAGQTLGIVGPTGAGKSTLCHLIPRLYELSSGSILLDGRDIRQMDRRRLRKQIAFVPQSSFLFSGTIRQNLSLGVDAADQGELESAAAAAQADDFIAAAENGFEAILGERGINLSGGQKQRLALGRALIRRSPLLILDDTSSALDPGTAARLEKALKKRRKGKTTIIVAQRLENIRNADKILVLEDGKIVGEGSHEDLLKNCALYRDIHRSQNREAAGE